MDTDKYGVLDAVVRNLTKRNNTAICDLEYTQDSDETQSVNLLANYQDLIFVRSGDKYKIREWSIVIQKSKFKIQYSKLLLFKFEF